MRRSSNSRADGQTTESNSNSKTKTDKYKFAVVKIQNKDIDDYVCVPSSWVIIRKLNKGVIIKYPEGESSEIIKLVKRRSELSNTLLKCKLHKVELVYETDFFDGAAKYIDEKKHEESGRRHSESKSEDSSEGAQNYIDKKKRKESACRHSESKSKDKERADRNDNSNHQQAIPKMVIKLSRLEHSDVPSHKRRKSQTDSKSEQSKETSTQDAKGTKNIGKSNDLDNRSIKPSTSYEPIASTSKDATQIINEERTSNENHGPIENNRNSTASPDTSSLSLQPEKHCTEENKENYILETENAQTSEPTIVIGCNNETRSEKEIFIERIDNNFNLMIDCLGNVSVSKRKKMLESYCSMLDILLESSIRKAIRQ